MPSFVCRLRYRSRLDECGIARDWNATLVNSSAVLKKYPFRLLTQAEYSNNTMRVMRTFLVVALMATAGWIPACAAERVDLLLVLAADISRSVDAVKFQLQRSGYAAAFFNSRVIDAIRGCFFCQAEDGIRDYKVTGVQTCALPIYRRRRRHHRRWHRRGCLRRCRRRRP